VRAAKGDVTSHWVDSQLDFARSLGIEPSPPRILVPVDESDRGRIDQALEADGVSASDRLIALHTGKGMNLDSRRWPVEVFSAFGDILAAELGAKVILTGTREEKPLVDAVAQGMKQPVLNWAGTTSLGELAALLERCRVVVCPDSGPMHLAAAVGTPVAAIFALKSDFPLRWHPYGVPMEILVPADRHCTRKCVKETCPRFSCFEDITPGEVLEAVKRLLEPFTIKSGPAVFLDRDGTVVEDAGYIADPGRLRLLPKAAPAIARLNRLGFPVICVSNQSGVARGYFGEDRVRRVNRALDVLLAGRGARIDRYYFCPHLPEGKVAAYRTVCNCRKPAPGMLQDAVRDLGINLPESYLVGDKLSDLAAGNNAGCRTILVLTGEGTRTRTQLDRLEKPPDFIADNLGGAVEWIEAQERSHP